MTSRTRSQPIRTYKVLEAARLCAANLFERTIIMDLGGDPNHTWWVVSEDHTFINSWECVICPKCEIAIDVVKTCVDWIKCCPACDTLIYIRIDRGANFCVASLREFVDD